MCNFSMRKIKLSKNYNNLTYFINLISFKKRWWHLIGVFTYFFPYQSKRFIEQEVCSHVSRDCTLAKRSIKANVTRTYRLYRYCKYFHLTEFLLNASDCRTHCFPAVRLSLTPVDCGRKSEYPERTHTDRGRKCKLHAEKPPSPRRIRSQNRQATVQPSVFCFSCVSEGNPAERHSLSPEPLHGAPAVWGRPALCQPSTSGGIPHLQGTKQMCCTHICIISVMQKSLLEFTLFWNAAKMSSI